MRIKTEKTEKVEGLSDRVRDELIMDFCRNCEDHDADESSCADHTCVVWTCFGALLDGVAERGMP